MEITRGHQGDQAVGERPKLLRAVIAADSLLVTEGLRGLLAPLDLEVVAEVTSARDALQRTEGLAPDLVFLESRLLGQDDPQALAAFRALATLAAVIVLSLEEGAPHVTDAMSLGACAYLGQDVAPHSLRLAVDAALQGLAVLDRGAFLGLPEELAGPEAQRRRLAPSVTGREWEVLALLARGLSLRAMAEELGISVATVKMHIARILRKLNLEDRVQAAVWAHQHGMGTTPSRSS